MCNSCSPCFSVCVLRRFLKVTDSAWESKGEAGLLCSQKNWTFTGFKTAPLWGFLFVCFEENLTVADLDQSINV